MSEGYLFPSEDWAREFCKKLNENEKYRSSAKKWEGSILFVVSDLPQTLRDVYGDKDTVGFLLDLWHGECRGLKWFDDVTEGEGDYILEATYEDWVKIVDGKLDPIQALITKKMKIRKGSIATILRFTLAAINMVKTAQQVPTLR
jgi:putative sterol carrier protein